MNFIVLLLTALISTHVSAVPTPRAISYARRNDNATILDMIAQYKQIKLKIDQAEKQKTDLLAQAQAKQLDIQKQLGFSNVSTTSTLASSSSAAKSTIVADTYTILTATGSAIVFVNHGSTRTAVLDATSTVASTGTSSLTTSSSTISLSTVSSSTSTTVTSSPTATITAYPTATPTTLAPKTDGSSQPVTIVTATGSIVVIASQGKTVTTTLGVVASPTSVSTSTGSS